MSSREKTHLKITSLFPADSLASPNGIAFVQRHRDDVRHAWSCEWSPRWLWRLIESFEPPREKLLAAHAEMRRLSDIKLMTIGEGPEPPSDAALRALCADWSEILRRHFPLEELLRTREPPN